MWALGPALSAGNRKDPLGSYVTLLIRGTSGASVTPVDSTGLNTLTMNGNIVQSAAQIKYGSSSLYFDGTTDYITMPYNAGRFGFGTGDFCVECWFYATAALQTLATCYFNSTTGWSLQQYNNKVSFFCTGDGADISTTTSPSQNTWYHVAVTRSGTTMRIFLNGTQESSVTDSQSISSSLGSLYIGRFTTYNGYDWAGYMVDFRITKGHARYTTNFTPSRCLRP